VETLRAKVLPTVQIALRAAEAAVTRRAIPQTTPRTRQPIRTHRPLAADATKPLAGTYGELHAQDCRIRLPAGQQMRKRIIGQAPQDASPIYADWLNVERLADVEITSEDPGHPIESALLSRGGSGWRAADPGRQSIRLLFTAVQPLRRIWLEFAESTIERTQEYVLRWSSDGGQSFHEIVRQQWNFSPQGATYENEDHRVELLKVTILELIIVPDTSGKIAFASLAQLRLA
jgi:hypothetical protein